MDARLSNACSPFANVFGVRVGWCSTLLPTASWPIELVRPSSRSRDPAERLPSSGSRLPRNYREQLAVDEALSRPADGTRLDNIDMAPPWSASDGRQKWATNVRPGRSGEAIEVHYVYNPRTGAVDDLKIKIEPKE